MLDVWVAKHRVGALDHNTSEQNSFVFGYSPHLPKPADVSLTMPYSLASYAFKNGLHPIFQMNLPEGHLRAALEFRFRKSVQGFDDLSLLEITGYSQIGRLRYANDASVIDQVPPAEC